MQRAYRPLHQQAQFSNGSNIFSLLFWGWWGWGGGSGGGGNVVVEVGKLKTSKIKNRTKCNEKWIACIKAMIGLDEYARITIPEINELVAILSGSVSTIF